LIKVPRERNAPTNNTIFLGNFFRQQLFIGNLNIYFIINDFLEDHCLLISIPAQEIVEADKEVKGKLFYG